MGANSLTVVQNNPSQAVQTGSLRHEMYEDSGGAGGNAKAILDETGIVAQFGRGATDPIITYMVLTNTNHQTCYIYPNAAGTGIIVSLTRP